MIYVWESKSRFDLRGLPLLIAAEADSAHRARQRVEYGYDAKIRDASLAGKYRLVGILKEEKKDAMSSLAHSPRQPEFYK